MKKIVKLPLLLALTFTTTFNVYADERADKAKQAFDKMTSETQALFKNFESSFLFQKLSVETTDYRIGESESTATQISEMHLKQPEGEPAEEIKTTAHYTISYDDELAKQNIIARIKTNEVDYSVKNATEEMDETAKSMVNEKTITDVYENGDVHTHIFDKEKGIDIHWHGKLDDIDKLYGQFEGSFAEKDHPAIRFKGEINEKEGFIFETTSPLKSSEAGEEISIESLVIKGKLTDIDGLDFPLARASITIKGLKREIEEDIQSNIDTLVMSMNSSESDKGGVNSAVQIHIKPSGEWIKTLSQDLVDISGVKAKFSLDNLPKSVMNHFYKIFMAGVEEGYSGVDSDPEEMMKAAFDKHGEQWIAEIQKLGAGSTLNVSFESSKGNGFLDLGAHVNDAGYTLKMLEEIEPTAETLLTLINIQGKSSLPAKLIEDAQVQMFLAMAYQKKGDAYVANIETKDKQLLINDVPFDLSMILSELGGSDEEMELLEDTEVLEEAATAQ